MIDYLIGMGIGLAMMAAAMMRRYDVVFQLSVSSAIDFDGTPFVSTGLAPVA